MLDTSKMKTNIQTDFKIFNEAIVFAKERGYTVPPMEWAVLVKGGREFGKTNSMRMWAIGLIYSHDFLKAFFGENLVPREEDNENMMAIGLWAEQVAYEFEGQLYATNRDKPYMSFVRFKETDWAAKAPTAIIDTEVVTKQLQDLTATIPVRTHKIKKVRVDNITPEYPAWQHGLRQMVEYDNPFLYLKRFMDYSNDFRKR